MAIYEDLIQKKCKLALVGLGYVGLPLAVEFSKKIDVIGYDNNYLKIAKYQSGFDITNEVGDRELRECSVLFTADETSLRMAAFIIIAVPTPVNSDKTPDLTLVTSASKVVGRYLKKNTIVVYESTVYPGVTEDVCIPILEKESGLKCGIDFKIGYSPERINPGDKKHCLQNIKKIVSGIDRETLETVAKVYELIILEGVHRAPSIKVAEAAKVVENSQRDINIAFMNEIAMILDKMDIDTGDVIEAMNTKWNALGFKPGLVGGHCISVDPYYFIYEAEKLGYHSQIIAAGRKVNDEVGAYIAETTIKKLFLSDKKLSEIKVAVLGITFKENCSDIRNSKVIDIIETLKEYGINPIISDPVAEAEEVEQLYHCQLVNVDQVNDLDCIIFAVSHDCFRDMEIQKIKQMFCTDGAGKKIIIDVKGMFCKQFFDGDDYIYWRF